MKLLQLLLLLCLFDNIVVVERAVVNWASKREWRSYLIHQKTTVKEVLNLMLNCHSFFFPFLFSFKLPHVDICTQKPKLNNTVWTSTLVLPISGDIKCWWWIIDWFNGDFDRTEESVGNGAQLPSLTTANDDDDNNKEGNGTGVAIPMSCELHKSQLDEDGVGTK